MAQETIDNWIEEWEEQLREEHLKYFVLKIDELFESLSKEEAWNFNMMLYKYNQLREEKSKPINIYWVLNRDEYNIESYEELAQELKARRKI